jgi:hypothetical protein
MHSQVPQLIRVSNRFVCSNLCGLCNRNGERKGTGEMEIASGQLKKFNGIMPKSSDATIVTERSEIFLQFSDSVSWRRSGFWRYPDSTGNRRISH